MRVNTVRIICACEGVVTLLALTVFLRSVVPKQLQWQWRVHVPRASWPGGEFPESGLQEHLHQRVGCQHDFWLCV